MIQYLEPAELRKPGSITNWPSGDPFMDIISVHEYWVVFDYDKNNPSGENQGTIQERLINNLLKCSLAQIKKYDIDGQIEPLFIGEMGCKSYLPGAEMGKAEYSNMLCMVESIVRAFNEGMKGASLWAWNMHSGYGAISYPGCWWETEPKGRVHPIDANYYPYVLLTRNIKRGSTVCQTTISGGIDDSRGEENWSIVKSPRVWACAFRSPQNKISLIIVNDSYLQKKVEIVVPGVKKNITKSYVTWQKCDRLYTDIVTPSANNVIHDELPPRSVVVYCPQ